MATGAGATITVRAVALFRGANDHQAAYDGLSADPKRVRVVSILFSAVNDSRCASLLDRPPAVVRDAVALDLNRRGASMDCLGHHRCEPCEHELG